MDAGLDLRHKRERNKASSAAGTGVPKSNKQHPGKGHKSHVVSAAKAKARQLEMSALRIQRAWFIHMDKTIFQLLKHTICAAEHYVAHELLKKVSPLEAELVKDPSMKCKVRFRFSGETFPPYIVFKIFLHSEGCGYKYFSGKNLLKPSSEFPDQETKTFSLNYEVTVGKKDGNSPEISKENMPSCLGFLCCNYHFPGAVVDAYKIMGKKKFYQQIMEDEQLFQRFRVTDHIDVVTMQDYMQYCSLMDEIPASYGGRNNHWRRLNLRSIPRTMMIYDIVDYAETGVISHRLQKEMKYLRQRPQTEEMRQRQLQIVSEVRGPSFTSVCPSCPYQQQSKMKHLGRRSKKAQKRVEKMKKAYMMAKEAKVSKESQRDTPREKQEVIVSTPCFDIVKITDVSSDSELENEEKELFIWCQDLHIDFSLLC